MIRLLSWGKGMYIISRGKEIKTARFILKEVFDIEVQANHDPHLRHEPATNDFICQQIPDYTLLEYIRNERFPSLCTLIDLNNIKLNISEINEMQPNNFVLICRNPLQSTPNTGYHWLSNSVELLPMPNCMEIEVPVTDDCADIVIIGNMTILDYLLPLNIEITVRSRDKIFLAAKNYLAKSSSREILLPDI